MDHLDEIKDIFRSRRPVIFFDYDGTLTPIVETPDKALLSEDIRRKIVELTDFFPVAIISGRDLIDVKSKVNISGIYYAGSHGFDIETPTGENIRKSEAQAFKEALDKITIELESIKTAYPGCLLEPKPFSIAFHFRNVAESRQDEFRCMVKSLAKKYSDLRVLEGKKVLEMQPNIDWDKGKAVSHILGLIREPHDELIGFYFGDDTTDEDAFQMLNYLGGIGFKVGDVCCQTSASYCLHDLSDVQLMIDLMVKWHQFAQV